MFPAPQVPPERGAWRPTRRRHAVGCVVVVVFFVVLVLLGLQEVKRYERSNTPWETNELPASDAGSEAAP